jgi:hypothetical protein
MLKQNLSVDETKQVYAFSLALTYLQDYGSAADKASVEYIAQFFSYLCETYDNYLSLPNELKSSFDVAHCSDKNTLMRVAYKASNCSNNFMDSFRLGIILYGESCIPTSHNAFSSSSNGFIIWPQQHLSIKDQLQIGVWGFMLDIYADSKKAVVLRHESSNLNGVVKPINGEDILFYDTFKEFTNFLKEQFSKQKCATITILLMG